VADAVMELVSVHVVKHRNRAPSIVEARVRTALAPPASTDGRNLTRTSEKLPKKFLDITYSIQ
jgi:hypothetical protein